MPSEREERLRVALRERLRHAVAYHGRVADYATVIALDPIQAELHEGGHTITEGDDLLLGHAVKLYIANYGLEVADDDGDGGDTLVVNEMHDGNWAATDVLHDKDVS